MAARGPVPSGRAPGEGGAAAIDIERMRQVRQLFDALCELPAGEWQVALDDPALDPVVAAETRGLLAAQGDSGDRGDPVEREVARMLALAQEADQHAELGAGDALGPWRLLEEIGAGGMGKVFLAERADGLYRRQVAIKLLKGVADGGQAERLQFERQVLASLRLPHVARLYDGGTTPGGQPYLVMEYVAGMPLDTWCERQCLSIPARIALFLQVCDSVRAAHEQLVVHCDLKPANVLVGADGVPVLLDFGVARLLGDAASATSLRMYTPAYAAPELRDEGHASVRTDVFSLGVILLELLAARACERGRDARPTLPAPSAWTQRDAAWRRRLRGDLDAIVARACAPDPAARYPNVEALAADLRRHALHRPVQARAGQHGYVAGRFLRRNWQAVALALVAVAVVAGFITSLVDARRNAEQEARSARETSAYLVAMFEGTYPRRRGQDADSPLSARELLDAASQRVASDLRDAPLQRARLQAALGEAYMNLGVGRAAQPLLESAAATLQTQGPAAVGEAARAHALLAIEQANGGDAGAALATVERGTRLLEQQPRPQAQAWLALARGVALTTGQDYPGAEAALRGAQQPLARLDTRETADLRARIDYQMALLYWRWGRLDQSERLYRQLLAGTPASRISLVHDLETRLAQVLREAGRFAEARHLLENGMTRATALYGADSRFVLLQQEALTDLYTDMGDYPAADREFTRMLPRIRAVEGEGSVRESQALHNHADLLALRGDMPRAERLFRHALEMRRQALGAQATMSLRAEASLAALLIAQGRGDAARPLLAHAQAGLTRQLPADAPALRELAESRIRLALLDGDARQARTLFERLPPASAAPREKLARLELDRAIALAQADPARVAHIGREGLALAAGSLGEEHIDTARWRLFHALSLHAQGEDPAASTALAAAIPVMHRQLLPASAERHTAHALQAALRARR